MSLKIAIFLSFVFLTAVTFAVGYHYGAPHFYYTLVLGAQIIFLSFYYDTIRLFLSTLLSISASPQKSHADTRLLKAIGKLQEMSSTEEFDSTIEESLYQIFGFEKIEIFYSGKIAQNKFATVPDVYTYITRQQLVSKYTQLPADFFLVIPKHFPDSTIKSYLKEIGVDALLVFFHRDEVLCVIQAYGGVEVNSYHHKRIRLLTRYMNIALFRLVQIHRLIEEELVLEKRRTETMQSLAGSIAHEIRNPLNILSMIMRVIDHKIPTIVEALEDSPGSKEITEDMRECIDDCFATISRANIVTDIILNNIKANSEEVELSPLSVARCVGIALNEYGYHENERERVKLAIENDFTFMGEENLFIFVLFNLLKNSLFYVEAFPDMKITISLHVSDHFNYLHFRDTGPGISQEKIDRIFNNFYTDGKSDGVGLGLAYCKRTMESFGGRISCNSKEGEYTEFVLQFPAAVEEQMPVPLAAAAKAS